MSSADVKSMVSTGLATLASCNYDLKSAVLGKKVMNILCIGHGGGTLPLFLGSKIQGWKCNFCFKYTLSLWHPYVVEKQLED